MKKKKRAAFGTLAALTAAAAIVPAAPAAASCSQPLKQPDIGCIEGPICNVGSKLGLQCVD